MCFKLRQRHVKALNLTVEELTDIRYHGILNINIRNSTAVGKEIKIKPKDLSSSGDLHREKEGGGSRRECVHMPPCVKDPRVQGKSSQVKQREFHQRFLL